MNRDYTTDIPVQRGRILFLDDTHIEGQENLTRNFHQARRLCDHPLIVADIPTDLVNVSIYGTVLRSLPEGPGPEGPGPDDDLHMWYHAQRFTQAGQITRICYACGRDGLNWEKPKIGSVPIEGSTEHNVVADSMLIDRGSYSPGINVIHCPEEPDPTRRFRRIYQEPGGSFIAYSAEGINWQKTDEFAFHGSDAACIFYDCLNRQYVACSIAEPAVGRFPRRRTPTIARSSDFRSWSDFHIAFACDDQDDRLLVERLEARRSVLSYAIRDHYHQEVNNMFSFNYADMIIGIPVMFDCCGYDEWKGTPGGAGSGKDDAVTHPQIAWCCDPLLRDWRRPPLREPFMPISEPPQWDCGFLSLAESPVRMGDELWFYYSGQDRSQQHPIFTLDRGWDYRQGQLQGGISAARLRLDGFASLDADRQGGQITTRAFQLEGDGVEVNAVSYHGILAEVLDHRGERIPGFGVEQCVPMVGDSVRHQLRFRGGRLAQLRGRRIKLRLRLYGAMLFALVLKDSESTIYSMPGVMP